MFLHLNFTAWIGMLLLVCLSKSVRKWMQSQTSVRVACDAQDVLLFCHPDLDLTSKEDLLVVVNRKMARHTLGYELQSLTDSARKVWQRAEMPAKSETISYARFAQNDFKCSIDRFTDNGEPGYQIQKQAMEHVRLLQMDGVENKSLFQALQKWRKQGNTTMSIHGLRYELQPLLMHFISKGRDVEYFVHAGENYLAVNLHCAMPHDYSSQPPKTAREFEHYISAKRKEEAYFFVQEDNLSLYRDHLYASPAIILSSKPSCEWKLSGLDVTFHQIDPLKIHLHEDYVWKLCKKWNAWRVLSNLEYVNLVLIVLTLCNIFASSLDVLFFQASKWFWVANVCIGFIALNVVVEMYHDRAKQISKIKEDRVSASVMVYVAYLFLFVLITMLPTV